MKTKLFAVLTLSFLATLNPQLSTCFAQGTAFTYQGRLNNGTNVASGNYDLTFSLWNSSSGPAQVGATLTNAVTAISNGLFTVTLDFGNQFPGAGRWLEIGVRTNGGGAFATLSSRQAVTPAPYAVFSTSAGTASTAASVAAANITGTIPLAQLPANVVTNGASGVNISGTFSGNGSGLGNLDSGNLTGALTVGAATLTSLAHIYDAGVAEGVAVSGDFAYIANDADGLRIYNISNPASPVSVGHINDGAAAVGVAVSGNFAYLANLNDGLRIYNITNPASPVSVGHTNDVGDGDVGRAWGVAVSGNFAYLANGSDGLRIYNITNPASPVGVGHIVDGVGTARHVAVSGNFAYLANGSDGLRIYNISNPASPVSVGHIVVADRTSGVAVSGNFAYLANESDGLRIYNISNPASPVSVGHIDDGGYAFDLAVSGNFAYLAYEFDGLRIYNIANPASPVSVGHSYDGGFAWGVAVSGNFAYLANDDDGLRVYAIGLASAPAFQGDGSLLTHLDASKLTTGTFADARLSTNVSLLGQSIESVEITDGTIVDADISITAAIADTKLSTNVARRAGGNTFSGNQVITNGNVAIGTTTPAAQNIVQINPTFHSANGYGLSVNKADGGANIQINRTNGQGGLGLVVDNSSSGNASTSMLLVRNNVATSAQTLLNVQADGMVGIGTPSPAFPLSLSTNLGDKISLWGGLGDHYGFGIQGNRLQVYVDSGSSDIVFGWGQSSNLTETMRIKGGGNVGIGTNAPQQKLHVVGNILATGTVTGSSDRNVKRDFAPVDSHEVLAKVAALPISTWTYRAEAGVRHLGPMAQDFYAAFNVGLDDKTISMVDADGVALAAIQGLNQKLTEELKQKGTEITELKQRMEKLEQLLNHRANGGAK